MVEQDGKPVPVLKRPVTRRGVLGGTLAAASLAVTYAALGDKLGVLGGGSGDAESVAGDARALEKESVRVSHLLRRTGFGVTPEEHEHYQTLGLEGTLTELLDYKSIDDGTAVQMAEALPAGPGGQAAPSAWWLVRIANTKRPLQEKMVMFWHGLLTSQLSVVRAPEAMIAQNELFRTHAFDSFPAILRGVAMDPAMMVYLNMDGSQRRAPNENFARELMELFSLGVGNYTEQDVREAARAFTGWQVPRQRDQGALFTLNEPVFRPAQFDNGSKSFLGRTGNFRPEDIVDIISEQPAAGQYVTRRLYSYFVHPEPADADIKPFVATYESSGRNIGAVVEAMLRSDVFYSPKAYRSIVKSPVEYAVGALKAVGSQANAPLLLAGAGGARNGGSLTAMGQLPFEPPNVAGWPGGATWLNSATMFARLNFLNQLVNTGSARQRQQLQRQPGSPAGAQAAQPAQPGMPAQQQPPGLSLGTASQALTHYLPMVLDDNLPDAARQVFVEYAGGLDAQLSPEQLRGLVYLVLGSPQFHLS